jgi:hypothetical protein
MLRAQLRLVATAAAVGSATSVAVVLLLVLLERTLSRATEVAFALGTLALGFGLLGWSASVMLGPNLEMMLEYKETNTRWSEGRSRRAMARISAFGGGLVLASGLFDAIVVSA